MPESQPGRVQERAVEMGNSPNMAGDAPPSTTIQGVSNHGVTDRAEVNPNLVRAARVDGHVNERERGGQVFGPNDPRDGFPTPA